MTDLLIACEISDWFSAQFLLDYFYHNASYMLVFLFMVIESSFLPFPSEVVVPPAAYIAVTRGDMNIFLIVLFATLGAIVGALINYFLAMWLGRPIVYAFANSRALFRPAWRTFHIHWPSDSRYPSAYFHPCRTCPDESRRVCGVYGSRCSGLELCAGRSRLLARHKSAL